jgi:cytokinin riboside 5'-monophosphate phosphoribohydrolase
MANPEIKSIRSVTVYCSSSKAIPQIYLDAGQNLGAAIARNGWRLVYGGNRIGLMGVLADAVRDAGGNVTGISPRMMVNEGIGDDACDEMIITETMRERKALLEERGDAFIALPGGLGTFEEFFEILVGRLLKYHDKPIVLLNVAGYYEPLLTMIEHGIEHRFIKPRAREAYFVANDVSQAVAYLLSSVAAPLPVPPEPSAAE